MSSVKLQALADCARAAGVVGAGGGGFALADKLLARPYRTLIINAAQSEPLIAKDWAALAHYAECVLGGADLLREALGLSKILLASREEFCSALPDLPATARKYGVTVARLPDIYPLGYEKILKRELLAIPMNSPGPDDVLVINAETLRNLSWAVNRERPVTTKLITVAGAVADPISLAVPIGMSFDDCLAQAGGASVAHYTAFHNGVLAGRPIDPAQSWVSATTLGYVLLPNTHSAASAATNPSLTERRSAFFASTIAGRTQPMSAAYALFDLTAYRRDRLRFRAITAPDELPTRLRITPGGSATTFIPCVIARQPVERGEVIATQLAAGLACHASVSGIVESADANGITLMRNAKESST